MLQPPQRLLAFCCRCICSSTASRALSLLCQQALDKGAWQVCNSPLCPEIFTNDPGRVVLFAPLPELQAWAPAAASASSGAPDPAFCGAATPTHFRHVRKCSTEHILTWTLFLAPTGSAVPGSHQAQPAGESCAVKKAPYLIRLVNVSIF